jgi:hypothetical protein
MKMSNVIVFGLGSVVCASLLTACADGRGTNGFKSYRFSKEEMAQNKLKRDGAKPKVEPNQNGGTDDTAASGDIGTGNSNPTAALPPTPNLTSGPVFAPPSAGSNLIIEPGPANPSRVVDLTAKVKDLNFTIDEELKDGQEENSVAKRLVKGITVAPNGTDVARTISINAVLVIGGEEVVMEALDVPVKHLKGEENLSNMLFTLTKPCDQKPIMVKNMLQAAAKCRDEKCLGIEVLLSFEIQDPSRRAYAALLVAPGRDAQRKLEWQYFKSNIGTPKTFEQAVNSMAACPAPQVAAPASGTQQGQAAPAPAKSSLEECEQKDAEGFSVCDSEGEKNRMRDARRKSEPQAAPAPAAPAAAFTGDGSEHTPAAN